MTRVSKSRDMIDKARTNNQIRWRRAGAEESNGLNDVRSLAADLLLFVSLVSRNSHLETVVCANSGFRVLDCGSRALCSKNLWF